MKAEWRLNDFWDVEEKKEGVSEGKGESGRGDVGELWIS